MPRSLAEEIIETAKAQGMMLATAESCTGGMVAAALTDIAGASAAFERGFVTYTNEAKIALGVDGELLQAHGAVSREVAQSMAEAALDKIAAHGKRLAISITGIAGPGGGSAEKPVGLVWFGLSMRGEKIIDKTESKNFTGGRDAVRKAATEHALRMILAHL